MLDIFSVSFPGTGCSIVAIKTSNSVIEGKEIIQVSEVGSREIFPVSFFNF